MSDIPSNIDPLHLVDLQNPQHPSVFEENTNYNMLILRLPKLHQETIRTEYLNFIFTPTETHQYHQELSTFEKLENSLYIPYQRINQTVDKLFESFVEYQEQIVDMEEALYTNPSHTFLTQWLKLKSELLRIERILLRTTRALDSFMDFYTETPEFPRNKYSDIHEHLERIMRTATLELSKLDDLYNFYNAQSNDRMTRMVYILTIISAIFLPLNLIVGFFGMNTSDLPFTTQTNGTYFVFSLLVLSLVFTSVLLLFSRK